MRVRTEAVQFKADQKLIEHIDKKLQKMDQFFDRIIEAKVTLKLENSGQVKDKIAEVQLSVPGDVLIVKETSKTFEASIDTAVDVLKRQLIKYKERLRRAS
ncbi:MAG: ribosome-associated translation inhibitor RaiA [Chitinophagales bacterium]|nr:ribosome-associated translation inhibitor RaiA [Chitinophagales bacterium]